MRLLSAAVSYHSPAPFAAASVAPPVGAVTYPGSVLPASSKLCSELRQALDEHALECSAVLAKQGGIAPAAAPTAAAAMPPAAAPASKRVFLSYARGLATTAFARWVREQLTSAGYSVR